MKLPQLLGKISSSSSTAWWQWFWPNIQVNWKGFVNCSGSLGSPGSKRFLITCYCARRCLEINWVLAENTYLYLFWFHGFTAWPFPLKRLSSRPSVGFYTSFVFRFYDGPGRRCWLHRSYIHIRNIYGAYVNKTPGVHRLRLSAGCR